MCNFVKKYVSNLINANSARQGRGRAGQKRGRPNYWDAQSQKGGNTFENSIMKIGEGCRTLGGGGTSPTCDRTPITERWRKGLYPSLRYEPPHHRSSAESAEQTHAEW